MPVRFTVRAGGAVTLVADVTVMDVSDHAGGGYEAHLQRITAAAPPHPLP